MRAEAHDPQPQAIDGRPEALDLDRRERRLDALTWIFVGVGIVLRLCRYGMNFPLWGDESCVAVNFIARGYVDLIRPLDYGQICPLLFLWVERWVVAHLGFSEWTLRLFPLVCGVASVALFRTAAGLVVVGLPRLLAVAILAVSFHPIRHAAEVKPYASDLLVALVLLTLALRWLRTPDRTVWLWLLVGFVPVALALSHPAVFVAGGISLALAIPIGKRRRLREWLPFALYLVAMTATFLALFALVTGLQERVALGGLRIYWADAFPPRDGLLPLVRWLVAVHTGTMLAYPGGGNHGASTATLVAVVAGSIVLWRRGGRAPLVLFLAPFALALLAAALRRYPYGVEARQMQFVAPAICALAGLGAARLLEAFAAGWARSSLASLTVTLLFGFAVTAIAGDVVRPYRFLYDQQARAFARRFWPDQAERAELACLRSDFGITSRGSKNMRTAVFLCNQWIYSPQRRGHGGPRWDALTSERPLRCVLYRDISPDHPKVVAWLATMKRTFDLRRIEPIDVDNAGAQSGARIERLVIFEFVPKPGIALAGPAVAGEGLRVPPLRR